MRIPCIFALALASFGFIGCGAQDLAELDTESAGEPGGLTGDNGGGPVDEEDLLADGLLDENGAEALPADVAASDSALTTTPTFGFVSGPDRTSASRSKYASYARELSGKTMRLWFSIVKYKPVDGAPDWYGDRLKELKTKIDSYKAAGLNINVAVSGGDCRTTTCPGTPTKIGGTRSDGSPKTSVDAFFERFASDLGSTYLGKIQTIEVWNEWDHVYGNFSPKTYTQDILRGAYLVLKAHRSALKVIAGSVITGKEYDIKNIVAEGAAKWADGFAYHPYSQASANLTPRLTAVKSYIPAGEGLYLTEWGCRAPDINARARCITESIGIIKQKGVTEADYYALFAKSAKSQLQNALLTGYMTNNNREAVITGKHQPLFDAYKNGMK